MNEQELRRQLRQVRNGKLSRRRFIENLALVGLSAPMASALLVASGIAAESPVAPYKPTQRGGGGLLRVLWWQAPTLLNPHFAVGQKDIDASRIFYEPLAGLDPAGNLRPILAAEVPSLQNGGVARDGKPFTADDLIFNWEFAVDPATASSTSGTFKEVKSVEKIDAHTIRVVFNE